MGITTKMHKKTLYLILALFLLNIALAQAAKVQTSEKHYEIALELKGNALVLDHVYVQKG